MSTPFTVTTPIYYVNAEPHIGHTYTTVVADTLARYHRLAGEDVLLLTGTDEHGEKIAAEAAKRGRDPKAHADLVSGAFREAWTALGIGFDRFVRTTDAGHARAVRWMLERLWQRGAIDFREYEGLYCVGCERFLVERDLVDGLCRDHERAPERRSESNYFFRMSEHRDWLVQTLHERPELVRPERYRNEVLGMLREASGLEDLCISRPRARLDWGIPLPFDEDYVCYVWVDALTSYLSGLGFPDDPDWERRWDGAWHLIGKDILKPHGIYWPTLLRAAGLPLFRGVRVHGYWNLDDRKVSKSLGNMVDPLAIRRTYGFEAFRYFLLREMAFGLDAGFSEDALVTRINADLANNLGNLVSRTLNMTGRYAEGRVPEPGPEGEMERGLREAAAETADAVDGAVRALEPHRALESVFALVDATNRYLDRREPWKAAKDPEREGELRTTLHAACQGLRSVTLLLAAFLPETARTLAERLGMGESLDDARLPEDARAWGALAPGTATAKGPPLFPRVETRPTADAAGG